MPYKIITPHSADTAEDAMTYFMNQVIGTYATASERASQLTSPSEGMFSYLKDTDSLEVYTGTAWSQVGAVDTGWVNVIGSVTTNAAFTTTTAQYRKVGKTVQIAWQGTTVNAINAVDISNLLIATWPAAVWPTGFNATLSPTGAGGLTTGYMQTNGQMYVSASANAIPAAGALSYGGTYLGV